MSGDDECCIIHKSGKRVKFQDSGFAGLEYGSGKRMEPGQRAEAGPIETAVF